MEGDAEWGKDRWVWVKIKPGIGPQVLVRSIYLGKPFWGCPSFDQQQLEEFGGLLLREMQGMRSGTSKKCHPSGLVSFSIEHQHSL